MDVAREVARQVVVDDEIDLLHVDTAREHVGGDEQRRGALPQPTAAEVAADEERRRAARAARGPALVETFQAKKSTAPAQKPAKWTRDAMDAPQRMDAKAARAVIEKAKGLDSRFSSSYRQ